MIILNQSDFDNERKLKKSNLHSKVVIKELDLNRNNNNNNKQVEYGNLVQIQNGNDYIFYFKI